MLLSRRRCGQNAMCGHASFVTNVIGGRVCVCRLCV